MHVDLDPVCAWDGSDNLLITGKETCFAHRGNSFPGGGEAVADNINKDVNLYHVFDTEMKMIQVLAVFCLQITLQPMVLKVSYMSLDLSPNK